MLWAMGAILLHFQAVPQAVVPAAKAAIEAVQAPSAQAAATDKLTLANASSSPSNETSPLEPGRLALTPAVPAAAPAPASPAIAPVIYTPGSTPRQPAYAARGEQGPRNAW